MLFVSDQLKTDAFILNLGGFLLTFITDEKFVPTFWKMGLEQAAFTSTCEEGERGEGEREGGRERRERGNRSVQH